MKHGGVLEERTQRSYDNNAESKWKGDFNSSQLREQEEGSSKWISMRSDGWVYPELSNITPIEDRLFDIRLVYTTLMIWGRGVLRSSIVPGERRTERPLRGTSRMQGRYKPEDWAGAILLMGVIAGRMEEVRGGIKEGRADLDRGWRLACYTGVPLTL